MEPSATAEYDAAAADDHLLAGGRAAAENHRHGHLLVPVLLDAVLRVDAAIPAATHRILHSQAGRLLQRPGQSGHLRLPQPSSAEGSCPSPIHHLLPALDRHHSSAPTRLSGRRAAVGHFGRRMRSTHVRKSALPSGLH